jgi:Gpi18-like mannosyltransferase
MFSLGLLVRVAIAPHAGFASDLRLFQSWSARLAAVGTHGFYAPGQFQDYPPGYLYVLWALGKVSAAPSFALLKLPAVLADLGLAWVAGTLAARVAPASLVERLPVRALVAAAVLFNPAVIALSAVWGQVDSVPALLVLSSLLLFVTGTPSLRREIESFMLLALAVAMKPQAGFVLPVLMYGLYRRHLDGRRGGALADGALAVGVVAALALGLWAVSGLPFGLGPVALLRFYHRSASVYPVTSANAFNLWGAVGFWRSDTSLCIAGIAAVFVGTGAFLAGLALVIRRIHVALGRGCDESRVLLAAAASSSLLAFTLLTRMHERYLFLALACLAPLVFAGGLRLAYSGLSLLFVVNLWYPYEYFNSQRHVPAFRIEPLFGRLFGGDATDTCQKTLWSLALSGVALAAVPVGLRWAERSSPAAAAAAVARRARASRVWPLGIVGLSAAFGLVALRAEARVLPNLNDSAFHLQMVRWASGQIAEGRVPLDGWFPYLSLGSPFFHHYQSLAETLTAYGARLTGAGDATAYVWVLYLLLATWPVSVYLGARLLEWGRWPAAAAAGVAPLVVSVPAYGYEASSYIWGGYGVYSQLWAMWLLPLAWGLTWRAVGHGRQYTAAAAALALTIAWHFITAYLALLTVGVWVIVLGRAGFVRRAGRAALVVVASLAVAAWVLVPLVSSASWTTRSEFYRGTYFSDSYGARKVLVWLVTGRLFDSGRVPVLTAFVFLGSLVCARRARRDPRARALLGVFVLSLFLYFGRPTWGRALDLLPGFGDIQIHRFVMGVHLAGILLAGVGLWWLLETAGRLVAHRLRTRGALASGAVAAGAIVALLAPAWTGRAAYDRGDAALMRAQQTADATDGASLDRLVSIVEARGGGRVYAGLRGNWGRNYTVGYVPVYAWLANHDVDAIGFTFRTLSSLSTDVEAAFDETNPAQYEMLDVRYLLVPADRRPPVPATLLAASGGNRLYQVATSGYFQVVDRSAPIAENRANVEQASRGWRDSDLASQAIYPGVAFAGAAGPPPTFAGAAPPAGAPGRVASQHERLQDGVFAATVVAQRPAVVLLKATYDPRWRATVDGLQARPVMMAPSLIGVAVPAGRHVVRFHYEPESDYPLLLGLGALALAGLAVWSRRATRRSSRGGDPSRA